MKKMKRFGEFCRMGRFLAALFFAGCLAQPAAMAACTEEMAEKLVKQNLDMRLRFLKNEGRLPMYEAVAENLLVQTAQMISAKNWDGVCKGVFGLIAIADDVLAGGDGKTPPLKTPWDKCTPEKMLSLASEYDLICLPERRIENCARRELMPLKRELIHLKAQAGKGDLKAARYVNRTCELYTGLLRLINE